MFYSHNILTSNQYGVSTVWLVATVGPRSTSRKVTRKAIQCVDIPRACETIIEPGAPIALRLQGNLLYGVSRVYEHHCAYMLTDVEKMQSHMQTFFQVWGTSTVNPQAGKAKREQLIIMNDPAFELQFKIPELELDDDGNIVMSRSSQKKDTQKTSSQMSPFTIDLSSLSRASPGGLLFSQHQSQSPGDVNFHHLEMPFRRDSLATPKPGEYGLNMGGEEEPMILDDDWGIRIDADGNIVQDEPGLPVLPVFPAENELPVIPHDEAGFVVEDQGEMIIGEGLDALPEAEAFPQPQAQSEPVAAQESSSTAGAAPMRRQKRPLIRPDQETMIRQHELRQQHQNYLARMNEAHNGPRREPTVAQGRRNAYQYLFGNGIFGVAVDNGITGPNHPLAQLFSGKALQRGTFGFVIEGDDSKQEEGKRQSRGQRRSSGQAFPEDTEVEAGRRVRPRLDDSQPGQAAQLSVQEDAAVFFEPEIEVGRDPGSALSNISAPWNRPGSHPGSSVKGGSVRATGAGPSRVSPSPLHGRSATLPSILRFSDGAPFGSDGLLPLEASSVYGGPAGGEGEGAAGTSQMMHDALDNEGRNFLGFVEGVAADKGIDRYNDDGESERRWVMFDDLFEADDANKAVVTQAFCHILTLATKDKIKVQQEDPLQVEFGPIQIGLNIPEQVAVGEDEDEVEGVGDVAMAA